MTLDPPAALVEQIVTGHHRGCASGCETVGQDADQYTARGVPEQILLSKDGFPGARAADDG